MNLSSAGFRRFIESNMPNENGIITITQDQVFSEELIINYKNCPVEFTGNTLFNSKVTFDGIVDFTFKNCEFKKIIVGRLAKIKLFECIITEIQYSAESNTYDSIINYGKLYVNECNIDNFELKNFFGSVRLENNRINTLRIGGSNFLDVEILGAKSKNSIKRFSLYGDFGYNDSKRQVNISNCIIGEQENSHPIFFAAKGLNIILTNVDFISDVELTQPFNTI